LTARSNRVVPRRWRDNRRNSAARTGGVRAGFGFTAIGAASPGSASWPRASGRFATELKLALPHELDAVVAIFIFASLFTLHGPTLVSYVS
jgi:hypothetical protein